MADRTETGEIMSHGCSESIFGDKLAEFYEKMREITLQDVEASAEERRQMIAGDWKEKHLLLYSNKIICI